MIEIRSGGMVDFHKLIPSSVQERMEAEKEIPDEERARRNAENDQQVAIRQARFARPGLREQSGLVGQMWQRTFDTYEIREPEQERPMRAARSFVKHLPGLKRGLMIYGPTGTGKSHLVQAIVQACIETKVPPIRAKYVAGKRLGEHVKRDRNFIEWALDCEVLCLDDLDKCMGGAAPEWAYEAAVAILDVADEQGTPLMISTTEFGLTIWAEELKKKAYIIGRLNKLFHWEPINGPNGREIIDDSEFEWWAR